MFNLKKYFDKVKILEAMYDLTPAQVEVLRVYCRYWIWSAGKAVNPIQGHIAKELGISETTVYRAVKRLDEIGLLSKGAKEWHEADPIKEKFRRKALKCAPNKGLFSFIKKALRLSPKRRFFRDRLEKKLPFLVSSLLIFSANVGVYSNSINYKKEYIRKKGEVETFASRSLAHWNKIFDVKEDYGEFEFNSNDEYRLKPEKAQESSKLKGPDQDPYFWEKLKLRWQRKETKKQQIIAKKGVAAQIKGTDEFTTNFKAAQKNASNEKINNPNNIFADIINAAHPSKEFKTINPERGNTNG